MEERVKAIDYLNYYASPQGQERMTKFHHEERTVCKLTSVIPPQLPTPEQMIASMDKNGVERVFLTKLLMFSYVYKRPMESCTDEELVEVLRKYPDRFCGLTSYNPYQINESLAALDKAVKQYGFKGVFVHIYGFDISLDDRKMYPLYARCVELDIPVVVQVGYVLEGMPSEHARPLLLDRIALDFPNLVIIGSHTGYPWCEELIYWCFSSFP